MRTVKYWKRWRAFSRAAVRDVHVSQARRLRDWCAAWLIASMFVLASCASAPHAVSVDPGVDFAAHVEHRGLVIDRARGEKPAVLVPAGSLFSNGPDHLLQVQADGKTLAALWITDLAHVTVRRTADPDGPVMGSVEASWKEGAIQLTLKPADGPALQTGRFHRVDGPELPDLLTSNISTTLDERGTYRAELRDGQGNSIGWLRVGISPFTAGRRVYDAALPSSQVVSQFCAGALTEATLSRTVPTGMTPYVPPYTEAWLIHCASVVPMGNDGAVSMSTKYVGSV